MRTDGEVDYVFLMNFQSHPETLNLSGETFTDMIDGQLVSGELTLPPFGVRVLRRA